MDPKNSPGPPWIALTRNKSDARPASGTTAPEPIPGPRKRPLKLSARLSWISGIGPGAKSDHQNRSIFQSKPVEKNFAKKIGFLQTQGGFNSILQFFQAYAKSKINLLLKRICHQNWQLFFCSFCNYIRKFSIFFILIFSNLIYIMKSAVGFWCRQKWCRPLPGLCISLTYTHGYPPNIHISCICCLQRCYPGAFRDLCCRYP